MKMITFASINIGSYDVGMKIFELSKKHGMRELDYIRKKWNIVKITNKGEDRNYITREGFMEFCKELRKKTPEEISVYLGIPTESASLVIPSIIVYKRIIEVSNVELIWTPGITLEDGIAYEYAEDARYIRNSHDFENDICVIRIIVRN